MTRRVSGRITLVLAVFLAAGTIARADWRAPLAAGYKALSDGKLDEAEALMKQAVAMARGLGAEKIHEYAEALVGLSDVYLAQEKPTLVGVMLERALGILAESPHPSGEILAHLHTSLSRVRASEQRWGEAQALLKYVLAYQEKTFGPNDGRVADTLDSLAGVCMMRDRQGPEGKYEGKYYEKQALEVRVKAAGDAPKPLIDALLKLAEYETWHEAHNDDAISLRRRVLALQEKALGLNHPDVAETLMAIATAEVSVGQKGGLAVSMKSFPDGLLDDDAHDSSKLRAKMLALFVESKPLAERALAIRQKAIGPDDPKIIEVADFLAAGCYLQDDDANAERHLRPVVEARTKTLGPLSDELFTRLVMLSRIYMKHGRYNEAIPLLERVVAIEKAQPPKEDFRGFPLTAFDGPRTRSDEDDPENYPAQLRKAIRLAREKPRN